MELDNGESTYKPLHIIAGDYPVAVAEYARDQGLLNTPGWKHFRRTANNDKGQQILVSAAKTGKFKREPFWKLGFLVPRVHSQAMELDRVNNNNKWKDAEDI
jgi:hypothetical protein